MSTIDAAAYVKLENRVKELEATLGKLKGNLASSQMPGFFPIAPAQVAGVGGVASFDFQNIPATYSKLVIDLYARGDTAAVGVAIRLKLNNDATANIYKYIMTIIDGTFAVSGSSSVGLTYIYAAPIVAANGPASVFDVARIEIPNYANPSKFKTLTIQGTSRQGVTTALIYSVQTVGWYDSANAISRITLTPAAGGFAQYSAARLYGVL